jgi:2-phospho-L-lactate guanylyltransferase
MHHAIRGLARSATMSSQVPSPNFCVLVPVKPAAVAKSRLAGLGDEVRQALVTAFAADTVTAALSSSAVGEVMVVTDDHRLAAQMGPLGAHVVPDGVADDLNASLVQAAAEARRRWPDLSPAALCADLPALDGSQLAVVLRVAAAHPTSFLADQEGDGTTLVAAASVERFVPRFGLGSRAAHLAEGAHELVEVDVPTVRRDVDTPDDLKDALALGVGSRTARITTGLRL